MLIRFVVSNFLSFNEETEFNMIAGSFKTHKDHVYSAGKLEVLKSAAIYGANGAGKSNFIKALEYLRDAVTEGELMNSIGNKKFRLNRNSSSKPSTFEIELAINDQVYVYGISVQNITIVEEWLYESGINTNAKLIFERKVSKSGKSSIKMASKYIKSQKAKLLIELMEDNLLKSDELFIGKTETLKIKELTSIRQWIDSRIIVIHPGSEYQGLVPAIAMSSRFKTFANDLLKTLDTGVTELGVEEIDFEKFFGKYEDHVKREVIDSIEKDDYMILKSDDGYVFASKEKDEYIVKKLISIHKDNLGNSINFDFLDESDGTQRVLDFIPAFDSILHDDFTFVIDEIDQSLHPTLLYSLVNKIMAENSTKGQFIFTTHESNLLDLEIFRPDEIWFVEKNKKLGSTHLYSLSDFKPRYDLDIRKGYLKGRFGAIPFLAPLSDLNWQEDGI